MSDIAGAVAEILPVFPEKENEPYARARARDETNE